MKIPRLEQAGAIFTEDFSSIDNLAKRGLIKSGSLWLANSFDEKCIFLGSTTIDSIIKDKLIPTALSTYSIACWVYPISISGLVGQNEQEIINGGGGIFYYAYSVGFNGKMNHYQAGWQSGSNLLNLNQWNHIAFTSKANAGSFWLNGLTDGNVTAESLSAANPANRFYIGNRSDGNLVPPNNNSTFRGRMKDLIIFDRELKADEILAIAQNKPFDYEKNVVSEWDLSTINPKDIGYRNLANNGTSTGTTIVNGIAGKKATNFNGASDVVNVTQTSILNTLGNTTNLTISAWMYPQNLSVTNNLVRKENQFAIAILSNGILTFYRGTGTGWDAGISGSTLTIVNRWYHIVMTFDGTNVVLYVDGVLDKTAAKSAFGTNTNNILIGAQGGTAFSGTLDKVIIFDKALTNLEVTDLYRRQRAGIR